MIHTIQDVREFVTSVVEVLGGSFNPSTQFQDYVTSEGKPVWEGLLWDDLNYLNNQCFEVCRANDVDYYELVIDTIKTTKQLQFQSTIAGIVSYSTL